MGGYFEQEIEGVPSNIPIASKIYFPSLSQGFFYGHQWNTTECQDMVKKLNDLTGLLVSTFQGEELGTSFVVDGGAAATWPRRSERLADPQAVTRPRRRRNPRRTR